MSKHQDTYRKIFQASECPSIDDLFDYKEGKLNTAAMHSVERHLAGCALCSDALEGYQHISDRSIVKQQVVELGRRFAEKAPAETGGFKWGTLAAASVVVLISWGAAYLFMKNNDQVSPEKNISSAAPAPAEEKNNADSTPVLTITPSGTTSTTQQNVGIIRMDTVIANDFATYYSYTTPSSVAGDVVPPAPTQAPVVAQDEVTGNASLTSPTPGGSYKFYNTEGHANYNRSYEDVVADDIAEKEEVAIQEQQQTQKELEHNTDTVQIAVNTPAPRSSYQSSAIGNNQKAGNVPQKKDKAAPMERSKQNDVAITQAMQYYNNGNYDLAITTCKKLLAENSNDQSARFYLGMSYRKLKEDDKAYPELSKITATNLYYEEARWNMAMIDISKSRYETARKLLNEIVSTGKKYKEQAAAKLKEIDGK